MVQKKGYIKDLKISDKIIILNQKTEVVFIQEISKDWYRLKTKHGTLQLSGFYTVDVLEKQ